jgi:hypothetical protein
MGFHHFFFMAHSGAKKYTGSGTLVIGGQAGYPYHYISAGGGLVLSGSAGASAVSKCDTMGSRCFIIGRSSNDANNLIKMRNDALAKLAALQAIVPDDGCTLPTSHKC